MELTSYLQSTECLKETHHNKMLLLLLYLFFIVTLILVSFSHFVVFTSHYFVIKFILHDIISLFFSLSYFIFYISVKTFVKYMLPFPHVSHTFGLNFKYI